MQNISLIRRLRRTLTGPPSRSARIALSTGVFLVVSAFVILSVRPVEAQWAGGRDQVTTPAPGDWRVSYVVRPLLDEHAVEVVAVLFGDVVSGVVWRQADQRMRRGLVTRPEASDGFGQPLRVDAHPQGWTISGGAGGGMRLAWRITAPNLDAQGADGLGIDAEALYGPGYEVFLVPDRGLTASATETPAAARITVEVIFDIPVSWRILVPWEGFGRNYRPASLEALWGTILAVGDFRRQSVSTAGMDVVVGIQGRRPEGDGMIVQAVRRILTAGQEIYGSLPTSSLTVLIPSVAPGGAESLRLGNSLALGWGDRVNLMDDVPALHTLARELLRLWIGPAGSAPAWFAEGGTDYLAWLTLLRQDLIGRDPFRQRILRAEQEYLAHPHAGDWTFAQEEARLRTGAENLPRGPGGEAGRNVPTGAGTLARTRGLAVALALDATIARLSAGQRRFTDLVRTVHRTRGLSGATVLEADLMAACATVTGGDYLDAFFTALVFTPGRPPVAEALADIITREER
jgi:predicted metalloprotease with PDZ domain